MSLETDWNVPMVGGLLCLDFVNTVSFRTAECPRENLNEYRDWLRWSLRVGSISRIEADQLTALTARHERQAANVLQGALAFREALHSVLSARVTDRRIPPVELKLLNEGIAEGLRRLQVAPSGEVFSWHRKGEPDLSWPLAPVVRSAVDLLTSKSVQLVRVCQGRGCGWLFLDRSKNHSRRWCDMSDCGNLEKARRHYHRAREQAERGGGRTA